MDRSIPCSLVFRSLHNLGHGRFIVCCYTWILLLSFIFHELDAFSLSGLPGCLNRIFPDTALSLSLKEDFGEQNDSSLKSQLEQQQKQIDALLNIVQQQQNNAPASETQQPSTNIPSSATPSGSPTPLVLAPCKVMLFIDGTWLYYSLHERREKDCPIIQKYGRGWQHRYEVDWEALPRILCENLQDPGWTTTSNASPHQQQRPFEIVRASVFTSYKADTSPLSWRYRMFQEMKAANYDVHMMETVGKGEKCVDIQLAVEMMHFATIPHAYDVALLLTGDKDFMPAMIRTRQKGRKVGLVSMKRGCNRALFETPGVKDYDVIWLEDSMDQWIKPKTNIPHDDVSKFSTAFFVKIIVDFCKCGGLPRVSSRDLGRYLKFLQLPESNASSRSSCVLDELKYLYGGLSQFLSSQDDVFTVDHRSGTSFKEDPSDNAYWVSVDSEPITNMREAGNGWTEYEKAFFDRYTTDVLTKQRGKAYYHTLLVLFGEGKPNQHVILKQPERAISLPSDLTRDYSECTLKELKERCRKRGLPVSGVKRVLVERIEKDVKEQIAELSERNAVVQLASSTTSAGSAVTASAQSSNYLTDLVVEYVKARGGTANSRDVGRYLAANRPSDGTKRMTALQELKNGFGNLGNFVLQQSDTLVRSDDQIQGESSAAFPISLRDN